MDANKHSERIDLHLGMARLRHSQSQSPDASDARRDHLRVEAEIHMTLATILARLDCLGEEPAIDAIATRVDRLENARKGVIGIGGRKR